MLKRRTPLAHFAWTHCALLHFEPPISWLLKHVETCTVKRGCYIFLSKHSERRENGRQFHHQKGDFPAVLSRRVPRCYIFRSPYTGFSGGLRRILTKRVATFLFENTTIDEEIFIDESSWINRGIHVATV
jgi:hypothetical protein